MSRSASSEHRGCREISATLDQRNSGFTKPPSVVLQHLIELELVIPVMLFKIKLFFYQIPKIDLLLPGTREEERHLSEGSVFYKDALLII